MVERGARIEEKLEKLIILGNTTFEKLIILDNMTFSIFRLSFSPICGMRNCVKCNCQLATNGKRGIGDFSDTSHDLLAM